MYYAYILRLINEEYYVGSTDNLKRRVVEHKRGEVESTRKFLPCKLICYVAFSNKSKSKKFENYLKSGSGFAFRNKHLI